MSTSIYAYIIGMGIFLLFLEVRSRVLESRVGDEDKKIIESLKPWQYYGILAIIVILYPISLILLAEEDFRGSK